MEMQCLSYLFQRPDHKCLTENATSKNGLSNLQEEKNEKRAKKSKTQDVNVYYE